MLGRLIGRVRWREVIYIEAIGMRTATAVVLPFFIGQAVGQAAVGLMIGLAGLYTCIADKGGAGWRTLLATAAGISVAAFVGTLVSPYPALAIPAMFAFTFLLGLTALAGEPAGNAGLAITLAFAVAVGLSPLTPSNTEWPRMAEFAAGGVWTTLLTVQFWRIVGRTDYPIPPPNGYGREFRSAQSKLVWRNPMVRHALRLAVIATTAASLYKGLRLEHGYWLIVTVLVILKPDWAATRQRAGERVAGSLIGGVIGIILSVLVRNIFILDALLFLFCLLAFSHSPRNYRLYVLFLTPFVVLMINIAAPGNWRIAVTRIGYNLAGGALALLVGYIVRERRS